MAKRKLNRFILQEYLPAEHDEYTSWEKDNASTIEYIERLGRTELEDLALYGIYLLKNTIGVAERARKAESLASTVAKTTLRASYESEKLESVTKGNSGAKRSRLLSAEAIRLFELGLHKGTFKTAKGFSTHEETMTKIKKYAKKKTVKLKPPTSRVIERWINEWQAGERDKDGNKIKQNKAEISKKSIRHSKVYDPRTTEK